MRKANLLDLILTSKEGLVRDANVGGGLSFSDHQAHGYDDLHAEDAEHEPGMCSFQPSPGLH